MQVLILLLTTIFCIQPIFADDSKNLRFGILSFRPKEITMAQWRPLAQELERALPEHTVELLPMTYDELDKAAKEKKLDFVLTNPEHYILLKNQLAMNAVATMITLEKGHPLTKFAGVIFTRTDSDIQKISDLNGKIIASPSENSLGGYLMQRWELEKNNIKARSYDFTGMPHDKVVDDVLSGKADAGFVRSGVLESMAQAGKITLDKNPSLRVLSTHPMIDDIPVLHSTDHYPEWSFNIGEHISEDMVRKISLALLSIKPDSDVAKSAGILGFNAPADYTPVEVLMLRLRTHPDELKYFSFGNVAWRYRTIILIGSFFGLLIAVLIIFLIRANRRFKKVASENKKLLLAVEQSSVSIFITDLDAKIEYANQAFTKTTGYELSEVIGKNPRLLKSGQTSDATYHEIWDNLLAGKQWKGELVNYRKGNHKYIASSTISPVREIDGTISHYLAVEEDITERKKAEELIQQLAFYDSLTNLPNRRKLSDFLNYSIALSHRENKTFAILMMDLDKFKPVNDTFGHAAGDELLKQVAKRISICLRESDMVARLGGDEFVIVLTILNELEDAAQVALKVINDLTKPFQLSQHEEVEISASIGICFYPQHGNTPEMLMDHADAALYLAKGNGRGCFAYPKN